MTAPYDEPGPPPPKRPLRLGRLILLLVLGVVVLCVGGTAAIGAIVGPSHSKPTTADGQRRFVDPVATTPAAADPGPAVVPAIEPTTAAPVPAVAPATTKAHPVAPATTKAHPKPAATTHKPPTKPKPKPSATTKPPLTFVTPGAFCSPKGALGVTKTGKHMQCKPSATDTRNRWRAV